MSRRNTRRAQQRMNYYRWTFSEYQLLRRFMGFAADLEERRIIVGMRTDIAENGIEASPPHQGPVTSLLPTRKADEASDRGYVGPSGLTAEWWAMHPGKPIMSDAK